MATIAITDELGTPGQEVAVRVSSLLGLRYVDQRELEEMVAADLGVAIDCLRRVLDDALPTPIERWTISRNRLRRGFADTLTALARHEGCVIRCVGSAEFLKLRHDVLRVRLQARREARARHVAQRFHYRHEAMADWDIQSAEATLLRWSKALLDDDWRQSRHYDLDIDTAEHTVEHCVDRIVSLLPGEDTQGPGMPDLLEDLLRERARQRQTT